MRFHHVGIACESIAETIRFLQETHKINSITDILFDANQDATVCMINVENDLNIELISGKQVENLVKKKITLYHTCYEVDNIEAALAKFETSGSMVISTPRQSVLFNNRRVAFIHSPIGIIEFVESM